MILNNVTLFWAKLDPANHDMGFSGDKPQWNVQIRTTDKSQSDEFKSLGLNPKVDEDDNGVYYKFSVRKDATKKDGSPNKPVPVVGPDLMPIEDVASIGNGTIANVKLRSFEWTFSGKTGVGFRLDAIQIVKLETYQAKGGADSMGFQVISADAASADVDSDDLY